MIQFDCEFEDDKKKFNILLEMQVTDSEILCIHLELYGTMKNISLTCFVNFDFFVQLIDCLSACQCVV